MTWLPLLAQAPKHLPFYWHLPILIVLVSLVYSATRYEAWSSILLEALRWTRRMAGFLAAIALILYVVALLI
jgi:hypothetical protein